MLYKRTNFMFIIKKFSRHFNRRFVAVSSSCEMDTKEELLNAFQFIGQNVNDKIADKCTYGLELCSKYDVTIEDFVDQWSAFTITHLKNASISLDGLLLLERKELSKIPTSSIKSDLTKPAEPTPKNPTAKEKITHGKAVIETSGDDSSGAVSKHKVMEAEAELDNTISYSERTDSGKILITYGAHQEKIENNLKPTITIMANSKWYIGDNFRYLFVTQTKIARTFNDTIDTITDVICQKNNLNSQIDESNLQKMSDVICGRIKSEDSGSLNQKSVLLEGTYAFNGAKITKLNISQAKSFSLFPGQVVGVRGINNSGSSFVAQEFFTNASPEFYVGSETLEDNIQIVVASGPFTTEDSFLYEPLQDLLRFVVETKPHILILLGPFMSVKHKRLMEMTETFEDYFNTLIDSIMDCLKFDIQVVLVSSSDDAHHFPIFPTPAYNTKEKYPNLTCAPNPCLLNINGVIIGASTLDILFHLTKQEISRQPLIADRISRTVSHLFNQRSFYPLYPNNPDESTVDYLRLLGDCQMDVKPHVLIIPSTLRCCVKNVDGSVFINPERLTKFKVGGAFAVINLCPNKFPDVSCQIRKI